ncbi:MAG: peptide chain release factor N(5)-glutamine methyltransferase [Planctomycetota bacterium]
MPATGQKEWTLLEILNWTTEYFEENGIDDARLNAELLLSEVTGLERVMLYARFERKLTPEQRAELRKMVKRRADRYPLQYMLGYTEFYGRRFEVDENVLVPRPETELVVDKCLEKLPNEEGGYRVLDVGTGSGVIAVTLACERGETSVLATDTSETALSIARRNAAKHGVENRIEFRAGHLFEPLTGSEEGREGGVDLIVSNPPYIPTESIPDLQPEVSEWEPREALDGGENGLQLIGEILSGAARYIDSDGWLILEIGEDQADTIQDMAESDGYDASSMEVMDDDRGPRVVAFPLSEQ